MAVSYLSGGRIQGISSVPSNTGQDYENQFTTDNVTVGAGGQNDLDLTIVDGHIQAHSNWEQKQGMKCEQGLNGKALKTVTVRLKKAGTPTATLRCDVIRNSNPQTTPEAYSDTKDQDDLTASYQDITFTFSSAVTLATDDYIVITSSATGGATGTSTIIAQTDCNPERYYANNGATSWSGGTIGTGTTAKQACVMKLQDASGTVLYDVNEKQVHWNADTHPSSNQQCYWDLGTTLDDDKWVCRFTIMATHVDLGVTAVGEFIKIGMVSSTGAAWNTNQEWACLNVWTGEYGSNKTLWGSAIQEGAGSAGYASPTVRDGGGGDNAFGENFTQGSLIAHKPFYIEISKDDDMIYVKRYTDSTYNTVEETCTPSAGTANLGDFRYFAFNTFTNSYDNRVGQISGIVDDVRVWDGVSSVTAGEKAAITNVPIQSTFEETDTNKFYTKLYTYADGLTWVEQGNAGYLTEADAGGGARGIFCGGYTSTHLNVMEYITISTTGDVTDFGDLSGNRSGVAGGGNGTRGIMAGGTTGSNVNIIEYVTIASTGNAQDFGDLTEARNSPCGNLKSSTGRNCFSTGNIHPSNPNRSNVIDYITVASAGNATDFGDDIDAYGRTGGCNNGTRGCIAGGYGSGGKVNNISYITMANTGNASDFGDLIAVTQFMGGTDNSSRGLFAGGYDSNYANRIDYITIASTGNAADFGDMTTPRNPPYSCNDLVRSIFAGGQGSGGSSTTQNSIEYVTTATLGNGTDFGDMTASKYDSVAGVDSST